MSIADLSNDISMVSKPANTHCIKTKDCSCGCEDDVSRSYIENDNQNTSKNMNAQHNHETEGMRRMRLQREQFAQQINTEIASCTHDSID